MPVKLFNERANPAVEWKMTSNHESPMKNTWQHNHNNKQPNDTQLTQFSKQPKLTWNSAHQTIYGEIQPSCKMKNDKQAWDYNDKHMTTQSLQQATKQHSTHLIS